MQRFEPVGPKVSFPELERRILAFWRKSRIFDKSLELRRGAPEWVFYEGPPTANGRPGIHHVESRTFKDVYPRFKTMTGHFVLRKAGWDCHGLPVELEVEKEIGTRTKRDIEKFGIGEFNRLCRESVTRYVDDWEKLTERIGFWIDLSDAYRTMSTEYIESVWWSLKELHRNGLLFEADKVTAYCPRCGTALSDHEVALGYRDTEDPSVYVRFPIVASPGHKFDGTVLLVWTTTPWTLISNTGVAMAPDEDYALVELDGERLILAERLRQTVLGETGDVVRLFKGAALSGARYTPPFPNVEGAHTVVGADFVAMTEGTGLVHLAPAFGADDLEIGRRHGWPVFKPVGDDGAFTQLAPRFVQGKSVKDADPAILDDLRERGVLLRAETYHHAYPFCWRCDTPLLYYARSSWYVGTTKRKDRLLAVNETVNWYPDHIKHGRYGDWLENNVDWALSRERYWGTPLPVWRCAAGHTTVVGSLTELSELVGREVTGVDPHRPAIDEITIPCPECGDESRRVPDVIDAWYDSGAMPFAQWGYHPELGRGAEQMAGRFPADFISEAIDQTRGWFYTLMAEATLLFDDTAYRNVVCLGHIVDAEGRKMSTRLGNIIDPWDVLNRQGADALRWLMLTSGSPWTSRRVSHDVIDDVLRQFLLTLWNVYSFFVTYANASGFDPSAAAVPREERPPLDRWILSQLARTASEARRRLDAYDATGAGRRIQRFVEDLSNWYVRRARRRFWDPDGRRGPDTVSAFQTLHECLATVAMLLAPFTPFVAEELWRNLAAGRGGRPESVHLADYPSGDDAAVDERMDDAMQAVRDIVELGRRVRTDARVKVRQPLAEVVVHYRGDHAALRSLLPLVADELNVKEVLFAEAVEEVGRWRAKPNFKALGPRLGRTVQEVAAALGGDDGALAAALARGESITVATSVGAASIEPDDVDLVQETRPGWGMAAEGGVTVALELELTPELRREGLARELVRVVQDARKAAGLDVSDRISLGVEATGEVSEALEAHLAYVAAETLAAEVTEGAIGEATYRREALLEGASVAVSLKRV